MAKEAVSNNAGVFALVSSVLSLVLPISSFPLGFVGGFIFAILGIVFSIIQLRRGKNAWAISALIISVLGLILSAFMLYAEVNIVQGAITQYQQMVQSGVVNQSSGASYGA